MKTSRSFGILRAMWMTVVLFMPLAVSICLYAQDGTKPGTQKSATESASPSVAPALTDRPDVASEYATLLKRVQQGDMTVNFRRLRLTRALSAGEPALTGNAKDAADRTAFVKSMAFTENEKYLLSLSCR